MKKKLKSLTPQGYSQEIHVRVDDALYIVRPIDLTQFKLSVLLTIEVDEGEDNLLGDDNHNKKEFPKRLRRRFTDRIDLYTASDRKRVTRECHERCFSMYADYELENHLEKVIQEIEKFRDNQKTFEEPNFKKEPKVDVKHFPMRIEGKEIDPPTNEKPITIQINL